MNSTSQLDFHPDAESLSAYAEQALPERERGQIVAHLAVCGRCRQVIFLAQEAASGLETGASAAVPTAHSAARTGSWLSGWRLAWIPAAALAAVVGLAVVVHFRQPQPGTEMARIAPESAPLDEGNIARPSANEGILVQKVQTPASPAAAKLSERKAQPAPVLAISDATLGGAAPSAAPATETVTMAQSSGDRSATVLAPGAQGQGMTSAQYMPEPATAARQPQHVAGVYSSNATAVYAPKTKMDNMAAERALASQKAEARFDGAGGASASRLQMKPAPHSSYDAGGQMPVTQFEAAREEKTAPLPSGLAVVSTVTAQTRTLAIDQAGTLFLSEDSRSHWEQVARQWAGRATEVRLQQTGTGSTAATAGQVAPPLPSAIFEIVNDKNLIWASVDGKTWKAQ
jgi:hypothetical protein